jgi:cytochrome c oxidase subunit 3
MFPFVWNSNFYEYKNFLGIYYSMTALHALHVIIGMIVMFIYGVRPALRNRFSGRYYTPVELSALYWHLVDLIWIYLFPLLYLVG